MTNTVTGELTHDALRGLSDIAIEADLQYVSGGAMIDGRYWRSVKALVADNERMRHNLEVIATACCMPKYARSALAADRDGE